MHISKKVQRRCTWIACFAFALLNLVALWLRRYKDAVKLRSEDNAVWVQSLYYRGYEPTTKERLTSADVKSLVRALKQNKVKYAYMFAGPYEKDGRLPDYAFAQTSISTTRQMKSLYPELVILPWVGGVINRTVFPGDAAWVATAVAETKRLVQTLQVPGVHVNFEFFTYKIPGEDFPGLNGIDTYAENQVNFHRQLRAALPDAFISTVIESTAPQTVHWKRKNTFDEVASLAGYVNQVAILFFDTSINEQGRFREALAGQLRDIERWKSGNHGQGVQFLLGIGTFVNKRELWSFRDLEVESIANTLETAKELSATSRDPLHPIDGLAIFADWTTSSRQWGEIRRHWGAPE